MTQPQILIIEARFYDHIADGLLAGVVAELNAAGVAHQRVIVPGIYEVPAALRYALRAAELRSTETRYQGYVTLGCAIRGESDHYEHICQATMAMLSQMSVEYCLALGNGILTVHNEKQALDRSSPERRNFGGQAARACLRMMRLKQDMQLLR